jgi:hypothetical protein
LKTVWKETEKQKIISLYPNYISCDTWSLSRKENIMALLSLIRHQLIIKKQKTEYLFDQYGFKEASNE